MLVDQTHDMPALAGEKALNTLAKRQNKPIEFVAAGAKVPIDQIGQPIEGMTMLTLIQIAGGDKADIEVSQDEVMKTRRKQLLETDINTAALIVALTEPAFAAIKTQNGNVMSPKIIPAVITSGMEWFQPAFQIAGQAAPTVAEVALELIEKILNYQK